MLCSLIHTGLTEQLLLFSIDQQVSSRNKPKCAGRARNCCGSMGWEIRRGGMVWGSA